MAISLERIYMKLKTLNEEKENNNINETYDSLVKLTNEIFNNTDIDRLIHEDKFPDIYNIIKNIFEYINNDSLQKKYGQYFTPPIIASLASAAIIDKDTKHIIDPMCGTGNMLKASINQLKYVKNKNNVEIKGFELNSLICNLAKYSIAEKHKDYYDNIRLFNNDVFTGTSIFKKINNKHVNKYEAVIGNPPYIRYQNIGYLIKEIPQEMAEMFIEIFKGKSKTQIADKVIRISLVSNYVDENLSFYDKIMHSMELLKNPFSNDLSLMDQIWVKLVSSYSGLADLSFPAWLLNWKLTCENSKIAFVTSKSWKSRDYAQLLQYYFFRFYKPLLILEQDNNSWFGKAQVSTSLIILEARPKNEIIIPLRERENKGKVKILKIKSDYDISNLDTFKMIANCLEDKESEILVNEQTHNSNIILENLLNREEDIENRLFKFRNIEEKSYVDDIFSNIHIGKSKKIYELENHNSKETKISFKKSNNGFLPNDFKNKVGLVDTKGKLSLLNKYKLKINQGLRTGCNTFFYLKKARQEDLDKSCLDLNIEFVDKVLMKPHKHKNKLKNLCAKVEEKGGLIPDNFKRAPFALVTLTDKFGGLLAIFSKSVLIETLRYQNEITHWSLEKQNNHFDYAFVTNNFIRKKDFKKLINRYPYLIRNYWIKEHNISTLSKPESEYIKIAEEVPIKKRNSKRVFVKEMSAVTTNKYIPEVEKKDLQLNFACETNIPGPPKFWYSMRIKQRHYGDIFMPRINNNHSSAYMNLTSNKYLIDANFSTITIKEDSIFTNTALLALLNSSWVEALLECISTPMGGGALKVEASHLNKIVIPKLKENDIDVLKNFGVELSNLEVDDKRVSSIKGEIDKFICSKFVDNTNLDLKSIIKKLNRYKEKSLNKRKN